MDLKSVRLVLGINQQQISQMSGINQAIISQIESGRIKANAKEKAAIEESLAVRLDWDGGVPHNMTPHEIELMKDVYNILTHRDPVAFAQWWDSYIDKNDALWALLSIAKETVFRMPDPPPMRWTKNGEPDFSHLK